MSDAASFEPAGIFGHRIVRRPQARGGRPLRHGAGARRDIGPEIPFLRPCLFRPQGRQGGSECRDLARRGGAAEASPRSRDGSDLHRQAVHLCRLLALPAHRRAGRAGGAGGADGAAGGTAQETRRRGPVRCRPQEEAALPARGDRGGDLADRGGDPRHHAPAAGALSPTGAAVAGGGAGRQGGRRDRRRHHRLQRLRRPSAPARPDHRGARRRFGGRPDGLQRRGGGARGGGQRHSR